MKNNPGPDSKEAITTASVVASGSLAVLKLLVGGLSGSLGILAEAAHSLLDLISTLITLLVVRVAAVPPDSNHPYGHERAEQLGALAGMTLLGGTGALILYHAFDTIFFHPAAPAVSVWAFAVVIVSLVVDFFRVRALRKAAASHASSALASDAEHFANDMLGAISVLIGLAVIALRDPLHLPEWMVTRADAVAALIVAAVAFRSVWKLGSRAVRALMDDVPIGLTDRAVSRDLRETVLRQVCARFMTVLGPGSDWYHEDHIHLDLMERHNNYRICQWNVWDPLPPTAPLLPAERPDQAPPREVAAKSDGAKPDAAEPDGGDIRPSTKKRR